MKVLSPPGRAPGGQETRHRWLVCLAVFWMYNTAMLWSLNVFGVSCEYGCWTGKSGHNDILKLHNKSWYMWHCTHHECYDSISQPTLCRYIRLPFSFLTIPLIHSLYLYNPILSTNSLYNINLRATTTTTTSIRGVQIPISLHSSTTSFVRLHIAVLKLYQ